MAPRLLLKTQPSSQPSLFLDVGDTRYTRLKCGTLPPAKLIVIYVITRVIALLTSWSRFAHIGGHVWRDITSSPPTHLCPPPRTFTLQKTDWHIPCPHIHIVGWALLQHCQRHNRPRVLLLELELSILLKGMQIQVLESFCRAFNESHPAFKELSSKVILPSKSFWRVFPRKN